MYDPDQGRILLDGHDLRELDPQWLRKSVGLVMQEIYLIPGTIEKNILLDSVMKEEEFATILKLAQLDELINRLPQGIHTKIGEGNLDLSGGQRQLLAMARVMVRVAFTARYRSCNHRRDSASRYSGWGRWALCRSRR